MNRVHQLASNQLLLLRNGTDFFPQLCADMEAAQHSIYLETYIFAADQTGRAIADTLQSAAARGVSVHLLLDGFGSSELPEHWVQELLAAGVEVQWFRREISPFTFRRSRKRRLLRLHRKLAVIDSNVAFVGGINIIDDIPAGSTFKVPRLDYAVRVQGSLSTEVDAVMRHLWGVISWANFRRRGRQFNWLQRAKPAPFACIALLLRDNLRHRRTIERAYLKAIHAATQEIIIANPYFLPGRQFRRALMQAARRGVRVLLLLQGKVEYRLQHYATRSLYDQLLGAGVEIYEYQASYLHAKVAVVDGQWATVGSSNIDPFSLLLAREANLSIADAGFAGELRESLLAALCDALRIGEGYGGKRNFFERSIARLSYGVVRLLIGLLGQKGS